MALLIRKYFQNKYGYLVNGFIFLKMIVLT